MKFFSHGRVGRGLVTAVAVLGFSGLSYALDVQSLIAGITAHSADARAEAWKAAGPLGAAAVAPLGKYLADPNPGITKAARAALVIIVAYAGRPGAGPNEAAAVAAELAKLLNPRIPDVARREVLNQLSLIGGAAEVPAIARALSEPAIAEDARMALERIPGEASVNALITALATAPDKLRGHIAASLAQRHAVKAIPRLRACAKEGGDSPWAWACIDALARLGVPPNKVMPSETGFTGGESLRYLNDFLTAADVMAAHGKRGAAERVYASVASLYDLPAQAAAALSGLVRINSDKLIPHAMGSLGTPELRRVAIKSLIEANIPKIESIAVKAYGMSNPAGRSAILQVLAGRKSARLKALLAEAAKDKSPEVRLAAARLSGKAPAAADLLEVALHGYPWSWGDAVRAYLELAGRKLRAKNKAGARVMYENIARANLPRRYVVAALAQLKKLGVDTSVIANKKGFVTKWRIVGPFPNPNGRAFGKSFFPETQADGVKPVQFDGKRYAWKDAVSDSVPAVIDLAAAFNPHTNVCAYGYAEVSVPAQTPALFLIGSDDGCEFWVNGVKKYEVNEARGMTVDGDRVPVMLKAGVNKILIKVLQGGGAWEYCVRVTDRHGKPLDLSH